MSDNTHLKEAVGIFSNINDLDAAVEDLESSHFARQDISVLGSTDKIEEKFGRRSIDYKQLQDHPDAPRGISLRPEEKTIAAGFMIGVPAYLGGCMAALAVNPATNLVLLSAVAIGSLIGAGIGGAATFMLRRRIMNNINEKIRKGGLLLWVRTGGPNREKIALDILKRNGGRHVHIHNIA